MKPGFLAIALVIVTLALGADMWLWHAYPQMAGAADDAQGHGSIVAPVTATGALPLTIGTCPCILQPVHIKARRWHAPPVPVITDETTCRIPAHLVPPPAWTDPPMPVLVLSEPLVPRPVEWQYAAPGSYTTEGYGLVQASSRYYPNGDGSSYRRGGSRPVNVPEPGMFALMFAGIVIIAARRAT